MLGTILFISIVIVIFYIRRKYSYWERKGVPGPKAWPLFGNIFESFTQKKTVGQIFRHTYSLYDTSPFVGVYRTSDPVLIVRDPEFINRILVKDSNCFFNNDFSVDKELDPLQGASPFEQKDEEWKATRSMLSRGFTSGKIKGLHTLVSQVDQKLVKYLDSLQDIKVGHTLETQNLCRRYTLENVALTAFGIEGQCFESDESQFMKLANSFIAPGTFALSMIQMFPLISNCISLKVIPRDVEIGLISIIESVLDYRQKHGVVVNDYLQFIANLGATKGMTATEITAHAATFFEDGYETSALVMSYVLFNLAQISECQQKVRAEIANFFDSSGKIEYEALADMSYLNACINESMRLCPVLEHYTRVCKQPFAYATSDESPGHLRRTAVNIDPGTVCIVPFGGLCHDARYFPDPEVFRPERFLHADDGGTSALKKVFYPFGGGHRVCLGQRFGLMQVRMGVIQVIRNYEVTLSTRTKLPFEFRPWTVLNKVKHGVWLTYKKLPHNTI